MAQTGYTPIQLYRTTTAGAAPSAGNLNAGELAFNINDADMALYAKNNTGNVKRIMNNPAGLKYPTADGTSGQAIVTDGSGTLSWATPSSTSPFSFNTTVVAQNYTFTTGQNAVSVGPITINSGCSVTVPSGQRWVVL